MEKEKSTHAKEKGENIAHSGEKEKSTHTKEKKEEIVHSDKNKENLTGKFKENPWILATLVLGVLVLVLLFGGFSGLTESNVTGEDAGKSIVTFLNSQTGGGVEYVSSEDMGNVYKITVSYQNQNIPVYVTKDGEYYVQGLVPITEDSDSPPTKPPATNVPKSDKPVVELFVWGYCPYGVQAQGPMAEVASLLGNYADLKIVPYYDGHGAYETQQNQIQLCIQKLEPAKYWDYASGFVEDIYPICSTSREIECDKTESVKLMNSLKINSNAVLGCVDSEGDALFAAASQKAQTNGVSGSPTVTINGVKINVGRTAEAYKQAICDAFTDGNAPTECATVLDSSATTTSGNC